MKSLFDICAAFFRERQVETYLVGGALRDELLGRKSPDLDFAVARDALPLARALADRFRGAYFPIDAERETARVMVPGGGSVDVALLRGDSIAADLAARDFSINAMARRVDASGELLDPWHGQRDLADRLVRVIAPDVFDHDPARMARAVRLAAVLNFTIEAQSRALIVAKAHLLPATSGERLRDELVHILHVPQSGEALRSLESLRLLPFIAPGAVLGPDALERLARREQHLARLARLDAGTGADEMLLREMERGLSGGRTRWVLFKLSALYTDARALALDADRLHFSRQETDYVVALVRHHGALAGASADALGAHRFFRQTGTAGLSLLLAALADDAHPDSARLFLRLYRDEYARVVAPKPLMPGAEIAEILGGAGPAIGKTITALLEAQASGAVGTAAEARAFVRARAEGSENQPP